jgi:F-type H+-transporting ATPase subunit delta
MTDAAIAYANAVFSLALEKNQEELVLEELKNFFSSIDESSEKFFSHPKLSIQEKHSVIDSLDFNPLTKNFLKVLLDNDRFDNLKVILAAYEFILNERNNLAMVKIITKTKLSKENQTKLIKILEKRLNKKVKIETVVTDDLISGFKVVYQGEVIDLTGDSFISEIKTSLSRRHLS